jgi:FeS assembly SUF system regulator
MFKLSKLTDYALVILSFLDNRQGVVDAKELAMHTTISYHTVAKICKNLVKNGLLTSTRGASGGYKVAAKCYELTFLAIIEAIEGPLIITDCGFTDSNCILAKNCGVMTPLKQINTLILVALQAHTLKSFLQLSNNGKTNSAA